MKLLDEAPPSRFDGHTSSFGEENTCELCAFLADVAPSRFKVRVLSLFLGQTVFPSTGQLALWFGVTPEEARCAVKQLDELRALCFLPQFGDGDLCLMLPARHSASMQRGLVLLERALCERPDWLWKTVAELENRC